MGFSTASELRTAENGYEEVGLGEVKKREWFSLLEGGDPATDWLERNDPERRAAAVATCRTCERSFERTGTGGAKRRAFCSKKCRDLAQTLSTRIAMRRHRANWSEEKRQKVRLSTKLAMQRARASGRARAADERRKAKEKERRAKQSTAYVCADCSLEWVRVGRVVSPPPRRCVRCAAHWATWVTYLGRARRRAVKANGPRALATPKPRIGLGSFVVWTAFLRGNPIDHCGRVVAVVPAGQSALKIATGFGIARWEFTKQKGAPDVVRRRESYLVWSDERLYWPIVSRLTINAAIAEQGAA